MLTAEPIRGLPGSSSEGPCWDRSSDRLSWVEIDAGCLHTWAPRTGATTTYEIGSRLGAAAPRASGGFVLATEDGFALLDAGSSKALGGVDMSNGQLRMNDGRCDPAGRFWAGTMAHDLRDGAGALYRLDPNGQVTTVVRGVSLSNGLGWSPDGHRMYFIDSLSHGVDAFEVDRTDGGLSGRRRLITIDNDETSPFGMTLPDGMTVDEAGFLWIAVFGSGEVRRYTPEGALVQSVHVPTLDVTSCTFGGPDLEALYITTGSGDRTGCHLYTCRPGVRGLPSTPFAG